MVSAARRAEVEREEAGLGRCAGCGGRLTNWTWDCRTCRERFRGWHRRGRLSTAEWDELRLLANEHTQQALQARYSEGGHPGDFWNLYPELGARR